MPRYIRIQDVEVGERQRRKMDPKSIASLKESIISKSRTLINAPTIITLERLDSPPTSIDGCTILGFRAKLVTGGRRLKALSQLHEENQTVYYDGRPIPKGTTPVTILKGSSLSQLLTVEYDENVVREPLEWQDQVDALAAINEAQVREAEEAGRQHTQTDTARTIQTAIGGPEKVKLTAINKQVSQALTIAAALPNRPDLQKAKSASEAYAILLKEQSERFEAELVRRKREAAEKETSFWSLHLADAREFMLEMPENEVDLILVDPPYGQGVDREKYAASTTHRYADDEQYARELSIFVIQEGWRITKKRANLFMFCSFKTFPILVEASAQYGWTPWYHPIVWEKSKGEGEAPWGRLGFIRTHEFLFWATRGQLGLKGPLPDVLSFSKVGARARQHGAEKPLPLLEYLIDKSTHPGDLILDPCAGSGSTLAAAVNRKRRVVGVEIDQTYYNRAMSRMNNLEEDSDEDPSG